MPETTSGLPFCDVYLEKNRQPIPGIIDLGAGMSLINYAGMKSLDVDPKRIQKGDSIDSSKNLNNFKSSSIRSHCAHDHA